MCDRAAHPRVDLGVHRLRVEQPLDHPDRRAARERLELGDPERGLRVQRFEHERVGQAGGAIEGSDRPVEAALPLVGTGEGIGRIAVGRREP